MPRKSSSAMPSMDRDYMAEDDHRTLMRASEISGDRRRVAGVKRHQRKQEKAMSLMQRTMLRSRSR